MRAGRGPVGRLSAAVTGLPGGGSDPTDSVVGVPEHDGTSLAERLGYRAEDKLVIISCDDLGTCHAAERRGVHRAAPRRRDLRLADGARAVGPPRGGASTRGEDLGVHLTLNAEHALYRWGPITHAPSLVDGDGGFPRAIDDLWEHADPEEVRRECRTQLERALEWGIDVTHLAPHLSAMSLRPEFFDVYLDLAVDFRLPIRLPSTVGEREAGFPFRHLAADEGVLFPDHFDNAWRAGSRERVLREIAPLRPGSPRCTCSPPSTRRRSGPSRRTPRAGSTTST